MKLALEQQYILSVLHSQYYVCWCSGDFGIQCISRHDIDPQSRNISPPASEQASINTLGPRRNSRRFLLYDVFSFKFHWNILSLIQLI